MEKGLMAVQGGIKKELEIPTLKVEGFIQAHQETPTHSGAIDVDARKLTPKDFMGYLEFNPRKFESHWMAVQMNPKLLDAELPVTAESAIIQKIIEENKAYMDLAIWQGKYDALAVTDAITNGLAPGANNLIFMDGFLTKMLADAKVTKIATPVVLDETNIFSKFDAVKKARRTALKSNRRGCYLVNPNTAEIYENAQQAQGYKGANVTDAGKMTYGGKPVEVLDGLPDDTILFTPCGNTLGSNLWLGVNDIDEETYLKLMQLQANSELWFIKMLFKIDVNYAFGEDAVLYTTFS
ncbi:hypothetical protein V6R21_20280 [Limibacter armeniacum]|uniref:hypothetical protein n=1 Tax=Limibacter armeniacum TaxID=466084 RepID=UPI002FE57A6B